MKSFKSLRISFVTSVCPSVYPRLRIYGDRKEFVKLVLGNSTAVNQDTEFLVEIQGGSNMTGTDLCVNKPHSAAAVRP